MTTLKLFYEAAEKAFKKAGIEGDFLGIRVKDDGVYFVNNIPTWPLKETLWKEASGEWETIYRSLKNMRSTASE